MTDKRFFLPLLAAFWLATAVCWVVPSRAQDEEFVPEEQEAQQEAQEETAVEEEPTNYDSINDLLLQDEEVLADPGTYAYDPGARRDPFRSLIQQRTQVPEQLERPPGAAGLLIDEIEIEGVFILGDGPVAQVQSASQETSFLLRPGDQVWDGDVVRITMSEIVFKQTINDPTALKPFREVVKKLNP